MESRYSIVVSEDRAGYFQATIFEMFQGGTMAAGAIEGPSGFVLPQDAVAAAFLQLAPIFTDEQIQEAQAEAIARPLDRAAAPFDFVDKQRVKPVSAGFLGAFLGATLGLFSCIAILAADTSPLPPGNTHYCPTLACEVEYGP